MKKYQLLIIIVIVVIVAFGKDTSSASAQLSHICDAQSQIPSEECFALVALYNSTNGASWTDHTDWKATLFPCSWYGVICSGSHVSALDINNNNLTGSIPSDVGNLNHLIMISFYGNQLTGNIPSKLGNLDNLIGLNLGGNLLEGNLPPELGNLVKLERLRIEDNLLEGPIPASFTNFSGLLYFYFNNTDLCEPQDSAFQSWLASIHPVKSTGVACSQLQLTIVPMVLFTATPTLLPTFTPTVLPPTETAVPEEIQEIAEAADTENEVEDDAQEAMIPEPAAAEDSEDDQLADFKIILIVLVALVILLIMLVIFVLLYKKK